MKYRRFEITLLAPIRSDSRVAVRWAEIEVVSSQKSSSEKRRGGHLNKSSIRLGLNFRATLSKAVTITVLLDCGLATHGIRSYAKRTHLPELIELVLVLMQLEKWIGHELCCTGA